jgi:hypothetical protein
MTSLPSATCRRMSSSLSWRCRSRRSWSVIDSAPELRARAGEGRRSQPAGTVGRLGPRVRRRRRCGDGGPGDGPLLARAYQQRARSRRRARRPQAQLFEPRRPPRPARRHVPHRLCRLLDYHAHRRRRTKDVDAAGTLHWSFDGGPLDADLQVDGPDRHDGALHLQSGCLIQGAALVRDHRHAQCKHVARPCPRTDELGCGEQRGEPAEATGLASPPACDPPSDPRSANDSARANGLSHHRTHGARPEALTERPPRNRASHPVPAIAGRSSPAVPGRRPRCSSGGGAGVSARTNETLAVDEQRVSAVGGPTRPLATMSERRRRSSAFAWTVRADRRSGPSLSARRRRRERSGRQPPRTRLSAGMRAARPSRSSAVTGRSVLAETSASSPHCRHAVPRGAAASWRRTPAGDASPLRS